MTHIWKWSVLISLILLSGPTLAFIGHTEWSPRSSLRMSESSSLLMQHSTSQAQRGPSTHHTARVCPTCFLKMTAKAIPTPNNNLTMLFFFRRTFLSWLNFTVVLAGLSIGLLNFGDKVGKISAGMFTLVSMAVMIYALITYNWRANAIRKRGSGPYDDRLGPTCLCISLLGEWLTHMT